MKSGRLFRLTSSSFRLPFHVDYKHQVITSNADNIPTVNWPNNHWCFPANVYLLELFKRNLSRKHRGGTLATYTRNIGHLIRFCYMSDVDVVDITDSLFTRFIRNLDGERKDGAPSIRERSTTSVITIGRQCLDFLETVGRLYDLSEFVGPKGRIAAKRKTTRVPMRAQGRKRPSKRNWTQSFWTHHSFPTPDPKDRRFSISSEDVEKILDVVAESSTSPFLTKRRYAMVRVLETGARRSELVVLKVESVQRAATMTDPMLKLLTAKRRGGEEHYRYVPIARHDLAFLLEYIEVNRKRIVRLTCGTERDDGMVFVSERTGRGLQPNTITAEVARLAKAAGLIGRAHPHMFRHRFAQLELAAMLEQNASENPGDFRRGLIDEETMKLKLSQLLGHTNSESADAYLRDALAEFTKFPRTYDAAKFQLVITSAKSALKQLAREIGSSSLTRQSLSQIQSFLDALESDIDRAVVKRLNTSVSANAK
jgi:integrase